MGYISLPSILNAKIGVTCHLCNSENGDTAWRSKNNSEWGLRFPEKKILLRFKKPKKTFKKNKQNRWVVFLKKSGFSQPCSWTTAILIKFENRRGFLQKSWSSESGRKNDFSVWLKFVDSQQLVDAKPDLCALKLIATSSGIVSGDHSTCSFPYG